MCRRQQADMHRHAAAQLLADCQGSVARSCVLALADGSVPVNEGRARVLANIGGVDLCCCTADYLLKVPKYVTYRPDRITLLALRHSKELHVY